MRNQMMRLLLWALLLGVMLVLTKFVLFKMPFSHYRAFFSHMDKTAVIRQGWEKANLKPFSTIRLFYRARSLRAEYKYKNIGGNIVGFIPLGMLLPLLFVRCRRFLTTSLSVLGISLLFETIQLFTGLGVFDVDDLILNTAGGMLGYVFVYAAWRLMQAGEAGRPGLLPDANN